MSSGWNKWSIQTPVHRWVQYLCVTSHIKNSVRRVSSEITEPEERDNSELNIDDVDIQVLEEEGE